MAILQLRQHDQIPLRLTLIALADRTGNSSTQMLRSTSVFEKHAGIQMSAKQ